MLIAIVSRIITVCLAAKVKTFSPVVWGGFLERCHHFLDHLRRIFSLQPPKSARIPVPVCLKITAHGLGEHNFQAQIFPSMSKSLDLILSSVEEEQHCELRGHADSPCTPMTSDSEGISGSTDAFAPLG